MLKKKPEFDRKKALAGKPYQAPVVRREEVPDGRVRITVHTVPPKWVRWTSGKDYVEKTYGLDILGREVYEYCDGNSSVKHIIKQFASKHKISQPEAEKCVTSFLKTLIAKGLVVMAYTR